MVKGKQELGAIQRLEAGGHELPQTISIKEMATGRFPMLQWMMPPCICGQH